MKSKLFKIFIFSTFLILLFSTSSFAITYQDVSDDNFANYVVMNSSRSEYSKMVILYNGTLVATHFDTSTQRVSLDGVDFIGDYYGYNIANDAWELTPFYSSELTTSSMGTFSGFSASSTDILFEDDSVFFSPPTPKLLTTETMVPMTETFSQTSRVLVILGIGLLALMMGLSLLPRILYKFL